MPTFIVTRDGDTTEDSVFDVDPLVDTFNPFGSYAVAKMDDRGGQLFEQYSRGTRLDITIDQLDNQPLTIDSGDTVTTDSGTTDSYRSVSNAGTYSNSGTVQATDTVDRFTGYVVEPRETEQQGADALEVEAYTFDQFLRRNTVTNDQTGNTITEALQDIIETDTPVSWVAANVDVGDDQELTRSYQGTKVENVLRDFAFKSNNENFGVNDALEFFFKPRETTHIDRGIDNSQWFSYDIPELGKQAINEVEVWFDDGNESVIVDDGTDKLDLQDSLDLPEPGTQREELNRPLITDINDAEDIGRKYLQFRNATLSGTVTTFGLYEAEPGDTIDITIDPRGIDGEFVIAAVEYRWGVDQTILTIVEKRGGVEDSILPELNDSVQRQEMQGADRDAPKNRITTTNATAIVDIQAEVPSANTNTLTVTSGDTYSVASGTTETYSTVENAGTVANAGTLQTEAVVVSPAADRFVNPGRRAVRDAWAGDSPPDITTLVVGDSDAGLSRSNTALDSQTASASVTETLPDAKSVEYSADINVTGVQELGLEAADGTLITRATFDDPVDIDGDVTITLDVSNDDSVSRGVLTNDGQTAVRDVLADNAPAIPTDYGYGSDGTAVAESDTALGNELVSVALDEILLSRSDSTADFEDIVPDFADDYPFGVQNGYFTPLRTTQFTEAENTGNFVGNEVTNADVTGVLGDDAGIMLEIENDFVEFEYEFDYRVPSGESVADFFFTSDAYDGDLEIEIDGSLVDTESFDGSTTENSVRSAGTLGVEFDAGESHTFRITRVTAGLDQNGDPINGRITIDTMQVLDQGDRYGGWSVNRTTNFDANSATYEGPSLFPDLVEADLDKFPTRRDITQARAELDINNTDNNQYIELSNDGSTFSRTNNASTATAAFASGNRGLWVRLGLGRWDEDPLFTPRVGDAAQRIDVAEFFANPDAVVTDNIGQTLTRAVVAPDTITGETVREAGLKNGSTLLTRHQVADFEVLAGQRISSSETSLFTSDN